MTTSEKIEYRIDLALVCISQSLRTEANKLLATNPLDGKALTLLAVANAVELSRVQ